MNLEPKHIIRVAMAYIFKRARLKYAYQVLRGIELKRGVNVESDRDILRKTNVYSVDEHYVAYLRDDSKVIRIANA